MKTVCCKTCGSEVPEPGMYCSATVDLVCRGRAPVPPCGAILTAEERHWYGTTCERCEVEWGERIDQWRRGGVDSELDRMFDEPRNVH